MFPASAFTGTYPEHLDGLWHASVDSEGCTALMYAASFDPESLEALCTTDAINQQDSTGRTALHYAILSGHAMAAVTLVRRGIDIDARDRLGRTALMLAALFGYHIVVQMLLEHGAARALTDVEGYTACTYANFGGHERLVEILR